MTAIPDPAVDPVWAFITGLPPRVKQRLNRSERLVALVHRATREHGWTVEQLVAECSRNHNGAANVAGIVMFRLEACAEHPPITEQGVRRVPFCSPECRDNAGWVLDAAGMPAKKCSCRKLTEAPHA